MKKFFIVIYIFISVVYIVLILFLFNKNFVVKGVFSSVYNFKEKSPFISLLYPIGRLDPKIYKEENLFFQRLLNDPIYFSVKLPKTRKFSKLILSIKFKNLDQPLIEIGLIDKNKIIFKPLDNKLLNKLYKSKDWFILKENGLVLFQKNKIYKSISEFLKNLPDLNKIALYNYNLQYKYDLDNYQKNRNYTVLDFNLKGSHIIKTFVTKGENLDWWFNFKALQQNNMSKISIQVLKDNKIIFQIKVRPQDYHLLLKNLNKGILTIKIIADDNIEITNIRTKQKYFVFENHIYFSDMNKKLVQVFTDSEKLNLIIQDEKFSQKVKFGKFEVFVNQPKNVFAIYNPISQRNKRFDKILLKGNIKIIGKGWFGINKEKFLPKLLYLNGDPNINLENLGIEFVIAKYMPAVEMQDGWFKKDLLYNLPDDLLNNNLEFVISFPFYKNKANILLSQIKVVAYTKKDFSIKQLLNFWFIELKQVFL